MGSQNLALHMGSQNLGAIQVIAMV
jgi:hypothetical protein